MADIYIINLQTSEPTLTHKLITSYIKQSYKETPRIITKHNSYLLYKLQ